MRRIAALAAAAGVAAACATACATAAPVLTLPGTPVRGAAAAGSADDLRSVCPATVVVQTNWWPQVEYGPLYQLLGGPVTVDTDAKAVTAPLTAGGLTTGVDIRIAAGGPAKGYTSAARLLYLDSSIMLGGVDLDQTIALVGKQPVRAVFAPMRRSPVALMWDPSALPDVHSIADLGKRGTTVLTFPDATYVDYLTASGLLHTAQIDPSYDGTPTRFVAAHGAIAQQGFVTSELYEYEKELPQWDRPVAWQLVDDIGYPNYPETFAVRADREAAYAPCLRKLVPILQRETAAYLADPHPTDVLISALVDRLGGYPYSTARGDFAAAEMKKDAIMGSGPGGEPPGMFDAGRVQRLVDLNRQTAAARGVTMPAALTGDQLYTNAYIDQSVRSG